MPDVDPASIDSFQEFKPSMVTQCSYKGCRNSARIVVYVQKEGGGTQDRVRVCTKHMRHLANRILEHYKFRRI